MDSVKKPIGKGTPITIALATTIAGATLSYGALRDRVETHDRTIVDMHGEILELSKAVTKLTTAVEVLSERLPPKR